MPDAGHSLGVAAGVVLAGTVLFSALQTVVLPRGGFTGITRFVFAVAVRVFGGAAYHPSGRAHRRQHRRAQRNPSRRLYNDAGKIALRH